MSVKKLKGGAPAALRRGDEDKRHEALQLSQPAWPLKISRASRFSAALDESPGKLKIRRRSCDQKQKNRCEQSPKRFRRFSRIYYTPCKLLVKTAFLNFIRSVWACQLPLLCLTLAAPRTEVRGSPRILVTSTRIFSGRHPTTLIGRIMAVKFLHDFRQVSGQSEATSALSLAPRFIEMARKKTSSFQAMALSLDPCVAL